MNRSRMRYESEIHDQQDHIDSFKNLIPQLEQQERQMLEKLKNPQTQSYLNYGSRIKTYGFYIVFQIIKINCIDF